MKNDENLDPSGTSLQGYFRATYKELYDILGEPSSKTGDPQKVSTEWRIEYKGKTFILYDWKKTKLYCSSYPTIEEMRDSEFPMMWNIAAKDDSLFQLFIHDLNHEITNKLKQKGDK